MLLHAVEERASACGDDCLVAPVEVEPLHEHREPVEELVDPRRRPVAVHDALEDLSAGELEHHRVRHRHRHLLGRLERARPCPAVRYAELDEGLQRSLRAANRAGHGLHGLDRVDEAVELEARIASQLLGGPAHGRRIDELVGEHDPRDPELPHDPHLRDVRRRDAPRAGVELPRPQLRAHRRLAVRRERGASPGAPAVHQVEVVSECALLEHEHRGGEVPGEQVPALAADGADGDPVRRRKPFVAPVDRIGL